MLFSWSTRTRISILLAGFTAAALLLAAVPEASAQEMEETPQEMSRRAKRAFKNRNYFEAILLFEQACFAEEDNAEHFYNMGYVYYKLKNLPQASYFLGQALEKNPEHKKAAKLNSVVQGHLPKIKKRQFSLNLPAGTEITMDFTSNEINHAQSPMGPHVIESETTGTARIVVDSVNEQGQARLAVTTVAYKGQTAPGDLGLAMAGQTYHKVIDRYGNVLRVEDITGSGNFDKSDFIYPDYPIEPGEVWKRQLDVVISGIPLSLDCRHYIAGFAAYRGEECPILASFQTAKVKNEAIDLELMSQSYRYLDPKTRFPLTKYETSTLKMKNHQNGMTVDGHSFGTGENDIQTP